MTTSNFLTATTGWIAIFTGVSAILALIFIILMYTVNQSFPYSIDSYSYYSKELSLLKGAFLFSTLGAF